jgi:putative flippase GtrA
MFRASPRPLRFLLVGLLGIVLQMTLLVVLVDGVGANLQAATVAAVGVTVAHNFAWHLRWTWVDRAAGASIVVLFARFSAANGFVSLVGNTVLMTVLAARVSVPVASLMAIAACGVLNYMLADLTVFRGIRTWGQGAPEEAAGRHP